MKQRPINTLPKVHLLVRPGSHLPVPAMRFSTARRARSSQGRSLLQRPPAGLGLDRPSTVLGWQEAVAMLGMARSEIFLSCGSDRRPPGPRPAASGRAGLGRAANARRAIERGPRPFGEEPPKRGPIFNGAFLMPSGDRASHRAQHRQGRALPVGLKPSLDRACSRRSSDAARSVRGNGRQIEQGNWMEIGMKVPRTESSQAPPESCAGSSLNNPEGPAFTRFTLLPGLPVGARFLSVLNAHERTASETHCESALNGQV
jgi:hypothetical protein